MFNIAFAISSFTYYNFILHLLYEFIVDFVSTVKGTIVLSYHFFHESKNWRKYPGSHVVLMAFNWYKGDNSILIALFTCHVI